jgi:DNA-binding CsgD family transcriptional regulator
VANEDDVAAITELINRNRIAIWMRDFDLWSSCFVHEPYLARWGWWTVGGMFARRGWDDISSRLKREMTEHPEPQPAMAYDTRVVNLSLRIHGDMAWATFEQHYPGGSLWSDRRGPTIAYEGRVFERHDGAWKIAFLVLLDGDHVEDGVLRVRLDGEGRVLSAGAALDRVLEDDDLAIRNGRLRVRDSRTDAKLQAAIRWAASQDTDYMPSTGSVPVVMEAGEGLATKVWWVSYEGGRIHFSPGDTRTTEARLDKASLIYGLSPTQRRVAALIADGLTLNEIAERMGITGNAARTHLQRIFDKTGVHNQSALVRVLLSAMAPVTDQRFISR